MTASLGGRVRATVLDNVGYKVASLAIAIMLFALFRGSGAVQRSIDVPITALLPEPSPGNPVLVRFLEHHLDDLARVLKGNPRYIKNAIRRSLRESASATGSMKTVVLPPNPPPISEAVTRNFEMSIPSSAAQVSRTMKWPCVQHHSSPWPSEPTLARQACGSI